MRYAALVFACLPIVTEADTFVVNSRATSAVIFPETGLVTHEVTLDLPAGAHEILLPDLPPDLDLDTLRVEASGLRVGTVRLRDDFVPPRDATAPPDLAAAEARIADITALLQAARDDAAQQRRAQAAQEDRLAYLRALSAPERSVPADVDALRSVARMIAEESRAVREEMFEVDVALRDLDTRVEALVDDLTRAEAARDALVPEAEDRPLLALQLIADSAAADARLSVSFVGYMGWRPGYDIRLTGGAAPEVQIDRFAEVFQRTGENWRGVSLTLSSQTPSGRIAPSPIAPDLRRLFDPARPLASESALENAPSGLFRDTAQEPVADGVPEARVTQGRSGLAVTYAFSDPVEVASGADDLRIPFDTVRLPADIVARAVPLHDTRAYLVARFENSTDAPFLPAPAAPRFFDGGFVGQGPFPALVPGATTELAFGAIEGLTLTRRVLDRAEGDRGTFVRSNERRETVRIVAENLTDRAWAVELRDRVPYSEQDALEITYTAEPEPDLRANEDQRGLLQWNLDLAPGGTVEILTSFRMSWPDGMMVRP